jgi:hypothetical protein
VPTGQVIITGALTTLGINQQGGTPNASDSADALAELNNQWDAWGIDEGLIYSILPTQASLVANTASYTIGVGATINVPRPSRIYKAFLVSTVGGSTTRKELRIVNAQEYFAHGDLTAASASPDELYPDYNVDASGYAKLYLYPAPTCPTTTKLEIEAGVPFTAWTLVDNTILPQGYQDPINYALAFRLIPRFAAIVPAEIQKIIMANGLKAEERIRTMNALNRKLSAMDVKMPNTETPPPQQGA